MVKRPTDDEQATWVTPSSLPQVAHCNSAPTPEYQPPGLEGAIELARCLRDLPACRARSRPTNTCAAPALKRSPPRAAKTKKTKAFGPVATRLMGLLMPIAMKTFLTPEKMLGVEQRHAIDWGQVVTG